jgi:hypothetical protein
VPHFSGGAAQLSAQPLGGEPMQELYILKEVAEQQLLPAGYVLHVEETQPDDFGS